MCHVFYIIIVLFYSMKSYSIVVGMIQDFLQEIVENRRESGYLLQNVSIQVSVSNILGTIKSISDILVRDLKCL